MNVHTPERHPLESREQYRERRAVSKEILVRMNGVLKGTPMTAQQQAGASRRYVLGAYWLGQHTNHDRNVMRKACRRLGHRQWRMQLKAFRRTQGSTTRRTS